jgi:hypothetical protein
MPSIFGGWCLEPTMKILEEGRGKMSFRSGSPFTNAGVFLFSPLGAEVKAPKWPYLLHFF